MSITDHAIVGLYGFLRNLIGIIVRPYETVRSIARDNSPWELVPIAVLLSLYFAAASIVRTAAFRPYLLTKQFLILALAVALSGYVVSGVFWLASVIVGGTGTFVRFLVAWAYTLIPSAIWFFVTAMLFVLLPPPRTMRPQGIAFSLLFLIFSAVLLFWKIILSYLTVRFVMRLTIGKILLATLLASPFIALYGYMTYRFGIFRIPFI